MNLFAAALAMYKMFGREACKRALTPQRQFVEAACKKSGASFEEAMEERNEAVEELLEFIEAMVDADFEDPDAE